LHLKILKFIKILPRNYKYNAKPPQKWSGQTIRQLKIKSKHRFPGYRHIKTSNYPHSNYKIINSKPQVSVSKNKNKKILKNRQKRKVHPISSSKGEATGGEHHLKDPCLVGGIRYMRKWWWITMRQVTGGSIFHFPILLLPPLYLECGNDFFADFEVFMCW
jgi:hypothetical protein